MVREEAQRDWLVRTDHFPQAYNHCRPTMGDRCPYLAACHNAEVQDDPVGSGLYTSRTPHHDSEWLEQEIGS